MSYTKNISSPQENISVKCFRVFNQTKDGFWHERPSPTSPFIRRVGKNLHLFENKYCRCILKNSCSMLFYWGEDNHTGNQMLCLIDPSNKTITIITLNKPLQDPQSLFSSGLLDRFWVEDYCH